MPPPLTLCLLHFQDCIQARGVVDVGSSKPVGKGASRILKFIDRRAAGCSVQVQPWCCWSNLEYCYFEHLPEQARNQGHVCVSVARQR